jgi:predicted Zn-dependent protease
MQNDTAAVRKGLSRDEAKALTDRVLSFAKADQTRVSVSSGMSGFTRTAMNRVTTAGATDDVTVRITSAFGKRVASIDTNRLDADALAKAVGDSEALARLSPENPEYLPEPPPQSYLEVSAYYASTGGLTTEDRARAAALVLERSKAAGTVAAGFIDVAAGAQAIANSNGLFAYHASTGVASTVTVRTRDGSSSGWAGDEGADWTTIESERIADDAMRKCEAWRGKTALDPGTYEVVLEPTAVGMLVSRMTGAFDARGAEEGRSYSRSAAAARGSASWCSTSGSRSRAIRRSRTARPHRSRGSGKRSSHRCGWRKASSRISPSRATGPAGKASRRGPACRI